MRSNFHCRFTHSDKSLLWLLVFFGNITFWLLFHLFGYVVVLSKSLLAGSLHVLLHGNKIILKINKYPKMVIFGKKTKNSKVQMLAFIHWGETTLIASNRKAANSTEAWCTAGLTDINVHSTEATGQAFHRVSSVLFYFIFWSFLFPSRS